MGPPGKQKVREYGSSALMKWQTKIENDANWGKKINREGKRKKKWK